MSSNSRDQNPDISCLVALLRSFSESNVTEDDEGFEHPIEFYDEDNKSQSTKKGDKTTRDDDKPRYNRRRRLWMALGVLLVLVVLIAVLVSTRRNRSNKSSASSFDRLEDCGRRRLLRRLMGITTTKRDGLYKDNLPPWTKEGVRRLDSQHEEDSHVNVGCFRVEDSPDNRTVTGETYLERVQACDAACTTHYFGLSSEDEDDFEEDDDTVTCYCYVERPKHRLSIGPCHQIDVVYDVCDDEDTKRQEMEVYFDPHWNEGCSQDTTSTVRNFLVEENDVPFGFDIVTSEFGPSPFELYKDECGTNVYEVQTEVSLAEHRPSTSQGSSNDPMLTDTYILLQVSQGSRKLTTTVSTVEEDVLRLRGDLAASLYGSRRVGFSGQIFSAGSTVAGLGDTRQTNMMRSRGAQEAGSNVFTSFGVKRLAEVKIVDFDNKRDFVTFNPEFGALLRSYRQSDFAKSTAQQIFRTYGMFVVTRGIFGGFMELRATMLASDVLDVFSETEAARQCYESFVSSSASYYGFQGEAPTGASGCGAEATNAFEAARREYELNTGEEEVVGGSAQDRDLVVSPEMSTLLTSRDMYPLGDDGFEFRPLTDFLSPRVISPLEIKRYQIPEAGFTEIQEKLRVHLREELLELQDVLDTQCGDCDIPYMVRLPDSWGFNCTCHEPQPPPAPVFEDITQEPEEPELAAIAGTYRIQIRRRGEIYWGIGSHNQGTLVIPPSGPLIYNRQKVTEYVYEKDRKFLYWSEHGDVTSRVEITFYSVKDDASFFEDKPEFTASYAFIGVIDDGWFAADEMRGFLEKEEGN